MVLQGATGDKSLKQNEVKNNIKLPHFLKSTQAKNVVHKHAHRLENKPKLVTMTGITVAMTQF